MFSSGVNIWAELVSFFKSWLSKINCTQFVGVELRVSAKLEPACSSSNPQIRTSVFIEQKLLKWPECQPWAALLKEKNKILKKETNTKYLWSKLKKPVLSFIEATVLVALLLYSVNLKLRILHSVILCTDFSYAAFLVRNFSTVRDIIIKQFQCAK